MNPTLILQTLIGDVAAAVFSTQDLSVFLQMAGVNMTPIANDYSSGTNDTQYGVVTECYLAAALALRAFASKVAMNLQEIRIGDYMNQSGRNQVTALQATADAYEKLYHETPAWAIIESDESDLNALIIIRNYVLRTNP